MRVIALQPDVALGDRGGGDLVATAVYFDDIALDTKDPLTDSVAGIRRRLCDDDIPLRDKTSAKSALGVWM